MLPMNKRERISQWLADATGENANPDQAEAEKHPYYLAFFHCWNEQQYDEAHDVLEQLWLNTKTRDADFFKGLIQAAGAFVHLQKRFEHPLARQAQQALVSRCTVVSAGREKPGNLRALAPRAGCCRALPTFEPIRR